MLDYESEINTPNPVSIKLDQTEVHAPSHQDWGVVMCPGCSDKFAIGHHMAFPTLSSKERVTTDLLTALADDHSYERVHQNSYEF
jgi:hypothetical protein